MRQIDNARLVESDLVLIRPVDHLLGLSHRFITDCVHDEGSVRDLLETAPLAADERATCQPITYRNPRLLEDVTTTLRWRPLLIMKFDQRRPHVPLGTLAQALIQADQVLENPVYVTEGAGYESVEQAWLAEAQAIGAHVARLAHERWRTTMPAPQISP